MCLKLHLLGIPLVTCKDFHGLANHKAYYSLTGLDQIGYRNTRLQMALFNCGCIPLFAKYEDDLVMGPSQGIETILTLGQTKDSVSGLPLPTSWDEFEAAIMTLEVNATKAKSFRPRFAENQSVFGIPAPKGVDVKKTISNTAKKMCKRFPSTKEAVKFHELAVSPEGRALFLMSFWVLRAEQLQHLTNTLLQYLSNYYRAVLRTAGPAKDLIPVLLVRSLAKVLVFGCTSTSTEYGITRRKRQIALHTATCFVAKYFSGSLGLGMDGGDAILKVVFDTKAVSSLIASLDLHRPAMPTFMNLTIPKPLSNTSDVYN